MPPVTSAAAQKDGTATSWPEILGSLRQPTTRASRPIGTLTRKIQRQLAITSTPPTRGPSAAANAPAPRGAPHTGATRDLADPSRERFDQSPRSVAELAVLVEVHP
jgi:hypothetical protein